MKVKYYQHWGMMQKKQVITTKFLCWYICLSGVIQVTLANISFDIVKRFRHLKNYESNEAFVVCPWKSRYLERNYGVFIVSNDLVVRKQWLCVCHMMIARYVYPGIRCLFIIVESHFIVYWRFIVIKFLTEQWFFF